MIFEDDEDKENQPPGKYYTKCQTEKDIINSTALRGIKAKEDNDGRMPYKWYNNEVKRIKSTCGTFKITAEDIRNRVRAIEKENSPFADNQ